MQNFNIDEIVKQGHEKCNSIGPLKQAGEAVGLPPLFLAIGVAFFSVGFLLFGFGSQFICNMVGFVYPAYASFKALDDDNKEEKHTWLTYWVVFSMFTLVESFIDYVLYWVPLYFIVKLLFLVWLFFPKYQGANVIYTKVVQPTLTKYRKQIDSAVAEAADTVKKVGSGQKIS